MGIIGSFLGKDQQKDIQRANAQATADLKQGYDKAYGDYTSAIDSYSPYTQSGNAANTFYSNALGLNGADAQNQSISTLTGNPLFQGELGQESNAMARLLNAQGASGGGKAQLAAQRVFQGTAGNWLDRYNQLGSQGLQATNAMAGAQQGRGDLGMNFAATKAGNAQSFGNAMAGTRSIGVNNLIGLGGLALKAFAPTPT